MPKLAESQISNFESAWRARLTLRPHGLTSDLDNFVNLCINILCIDTLSVFNVFLSKYIFPTFHFLSHCKICLINGFYKFLSTHHFVKKDGRSLTVGEISRFAAWNQFRMRIKTNRTRKTDFRGDEYVFTDFSITVVNLSSFVSTYTHMKLNSRFIREIIYL